MDRYQQDEAIEVGGQWVRIKNAPTHVLYNFYIGLASRPTKIIEDVMRDAEGLSGLARKGVDDRPPRQKIFEITCNRLRDIVHKAYTSPLGLAVADELYNRGVDDDELSRLIDFLMEELP